jgi:hypothetical protein
MFPLIYPIISILAGILILIFPEILNFVIAIYLIVIGIVGIVGRRNLF